MYGRLSIELSARFPPILPEKRCGIPLQDFQYKRNCRRWVEIAEGGRNEILFPNLPFSA
jgi:hypothetical protein